MNSPAEEINDDLRLRPRAQKKYLPAGYSAVDALQADPEGVLQDVLHLDIWERYQAHDESREIDGPFSLMRTIGQARMGPVAVPNCPCGLSHNTVIAHRLKRPATALGDVRKLWLPHAPSLSRMTTETRQRVVV